MQCPHPCGFCINGEVVCFRLEKFAFFQLDAEMIFLTDGVEFSE